MQKSMQIWYMKRKVKVNFPSAGRLIFWTFLNILSPNGGKNNWIQYIFRFAATKVYSKRFIM